MRIFSNTSFNFLGARKIAYAISLVLLLTGIGSLAVRGLNYGIDFRGGSEVVLRFEHDVPVGELRSAIRDAGVSGTIKQYGMDRSFLLSTVFSGDTNELKSLITGAVTSRLKGNPFEIVRIDAVGPSIASDLKWSALKAMVGALLAILIYVGIRFELKFAAAGVVAIFHDVLIVLGLFSLLGGVFDVMPLEMDQSIIAAFLTIAGYSITDTVVVYDRIRERIQKQEAIRIRTDFQREHEHDAQSDHHYIQHHSSDCSGALHLRRSGYQSLCFRRLRRYSCWHILFNIRCRPTCIRVDQAFESTGETPGKPEVTGQCSAKPPLSHLNELSNEKQIPHIASAFPSLPVLSPHYSHGGRCRQDCSCCGE